jgi:hypothetical protein
MVSSQKERGKDVSLDEALKALENRRTNIRFRALVTLCTSFFGEPRIRGSHHIFKMPWPGDPRINLQEDDRDAKPYQVQQVVQALKKLREMGG